VALFVVPVAQGHRHGHCHSKRCERVAQRAHDKRVKRSGRRALASFFGPGDQGGELACSPQTGIRNLTERTLGVANKTLPCGKRITVCARTCARVRVLDRGPYSGNREFDLTIGLARRIGFPLSAGVAMVRVG